MKKTAEEELSNQPFSEPNWASQFGQDQISAKHFLICVLEKGSFQDAKRNVRFGLLFHIGVAERSTLCLL